MFINNYIYILPEIFLGFMILVLLIFGVITDNRVLSINGYKTKELSSLPMVNQLAILSLFITLFLYYNQYYATGFNYSIFTDQLVSNHFIALFKFFIIIFTILILFIGSYFYKQESIRSFEFTILILLATLGLLFFVSANDFILFYLSLELQSLSLFILCSIKQKKNSAVESGLKFFIIGSVSSGFLLFGCSLLYGMFGTLNFSELKLFLDVDNLVISNLNIVLIISLLLVFIGFFFKLAIVPFHLWLKEVYEGASTIIVMYIAIVPKLALICVFTRFISVIFKDMAYMSDLCNLFLILSILTIFVGILGALFQNKLRSFIAYSSITNMGYILLILASIRTLPLEYIYFSISIFSLLYAVTILSIFSITLLLYNWSKETQVVYIKQLTGLYKIHPYLALLWLVNLFSLIGIPPLAGFFGKFYFALQLVSSTYYLLTFFFLLFGVIASIYYLKIIKLLFFDKPNMSLLLKPIPLGISFLLSYLLFFILFFFLKPQFLYFIYSFLCLNIFPI